MLKGARSNFIWPLLLAASLLVCGFAVYRGAGNLGRVQDELAQVRAANQRLDQQNRALYRSALRLRSDPKALERSCRLKMGVVRSDEVVYRFPETESR